MGLRTLQHMQNFLYPHAFPCSTMESFPQSAVHQEQTAPAWVPQRLQFFLDNLLQNALLCMGSNPCQEFAPAQAFHAHLLFFRERLPAVVWRLLGAVVWMSLPAMSFMGCRGIACFTTIFFKSCRGISTLVPGAPTPLL